MTSKTIHVLRFSAMGDVAMLIPSLLKFNHSNPDFQILLYTRQKFIPLFRELNFVKAVPIDINGKIGFRSLLQILVVLSRSESRIVLDMHNVLRTIFLRFCLQFMGVKCYVLKKNRKERLEKIRMAKKDLTPVKSFIDRYSDVFRKAGFVVSNDIILLDKIPNDEIMIGLSLFAKTESKSYDLTKILQTVKLLSKHKAVKFCIFGSGESERKASEIHFSEQPNVVNFIDQMSLEQELVWIRKLKLMISMDSANGHIASNYGIPVLTLWGPTHPCLGFQPFNQPNSNSLLPDKSLYPYLPVSLHGKMNPKHPYSRAIDSIEPNTIYNKVLEILNLNAGLE